MPLRLCVMVFFVLVGACKSSESESVPREVSVESAKVVVPGRDAKLVEISVEVVRTPGRIQRGLMFRRSLADHRGMLFLMGQLRDHGFWMRNTYIPLDMIFIDPSFRIVGIVENAEPLTDDTRQVGKLSSYVLEVPGGFCQRAGIQTGAKVRFVNIGLPD